MHFPSIIIAADNDDDSANQDALKQPKVGKIGRITHRPSFLWAAGFTRGMQSAATAH